MDDDEKRSARRDILEDIGSILYDDLCADAWGRLLVEVMRGPDGAPFTAGVDVEELFGDESRVDGAFGGEGARAVMPVLAKAVEALCALEGVELEDVRGGTFVRAGESADDRLFVWLPGLVHAPSLKLDAERDELLAALRAKNDALTARFGFPGRGELKIDLGRERLTFAGAGAGKPPMQSRATLLGTFAPPSRTWGWGASNPHVPNAVSRASATVIDSILERDAWELGTPIFATDETTAWALAAFVSDRVAGDGVYCASGQGGQGQQEEDDGLVFILLRDVREG
jgi:hypothetical protein